MKLGRQLLQKVPTKRIRTLFVTSRGLLCIRLKKTSENLCYCLLTFSTLVRSCSLNLSASTLTWVPRVLAEVVRAAEESMLGGYMENLNEHDPVRIDNTAF